MYKNINMSIVFSDKIKQFSVYINMFIHAAFTYTYKSIGQLSSLIFEWVTS